MAHRPRRTHGRRAPGSTTTRGYGTSHQKLRAQLMQQLALIGSATCPRCLRIILPGMLVDLGHTADRTGYTGLEHAHCNRSEGARRGNRTRQAAARQRSILVADARNL